MQKTYIYALKDPNSDAIRYVGKSDTPRARFSTHVSDAKNEKNKYHCAAWIRSLLRKNQQPRLEIIDEVEDGENAGYPLEAAYIEFFQERGCNLTNSTPGGNCGPVMRGEKHPAFGKKFSSETCAKHSASISGEKHPNFGKKLKPETCAKISDSHKGKKHSVESRLKISAVQRGKKLSLATREKLSAVGLGRKHKNNTSGYVGVCQSKTKWQSHLKGKYLGRFSKLEDAVFVRALAFDKFYGNK